MVSPGEVFEDKFFVQRGFRSTLFRPARFDAHRVHSFFGLTFDKIHVGQMMTVTGQHREDQRTDAQYFQKDPTRCKT